MLCDDPRHRIYLEDWKIVHTFDFEYEAAMLYTNLGQRGIDSEVFTKLNPDFTDMPLRPTIVEVIVPKKRFEDAMDVANSLGLTEEDLSEGPFGEDEG